VPRGQLKGGHDAKQAIERRAALDSYYAAASAGAGGHKINYHGFKVPDQNLGCARH